MNKKNLLIIGVILFSLIAIPLTVYVVNQKQEVRSHGQEIPPTPTLPASCQIPPAVVNVLVEYPSCEGTQCSSAQASCKWDTVSQATTYSLKISQVESGEVVRNDTVPSTTLKVVFPITQGKTYQCDVAAINSCGTGPVGTYSLLCATQVAITFAPTATPAPGVTTTPVPTVSSTPIPTISTTPTPTSLPTPTRVPVVAPPGNTSTTLLLGAGGLAAFIVGGMLFALLAL